MWKKWQTMPHNGKSGLRHGNCNPPEVVVEEDPPPEVVVEEDPPGSSMWKKNPPPQAMTRPDQLRSTAGQAGGMSYKRLSCLESDLPSFHVRFNEMSCWKKKLKFKSTAKVIKLKQRQLQLTNVPVELLNINSRQRTNLMPTFGQVPNPL